MPDNRIGPPLSVEALQAAALELEKLCGERGRPVVTLGRPLYLDLGRARAWFERRTFEDAEDNMPDASMLDDSVTEV